MRGFGARYAELEKLHSLPRVPARLEVLSLYRSAIGALSAVLDAYLSGEDAARSVRGLLGLGDEPALHLEERFEIEAGLRIFRLDRLPPWLAAMLVWSDDLGGCVAINADHPPEKQRWSLAHEVAHLLWDPEAEHVLDERDAKTRDEESFAEGFATELLLPAAGVKKRFADRCRAGKFTPIDVFALARLFEVPFQAMARRLEELRLLPKGSYDRIHEAARSWPDEELLRMAADLRWAATSRPHAGIPSRRGTPPSSSGPAADSRQHPTIPQAVRRASWTAWTCSNDGIRAGPSTCRRAILIWTAQRCGSIPVPSPQHTITRSAPAVCTRAAPPGTPGTRSASGPPRRSGPPARSS